MITLLRTLLARFGFRIQRDHSIYAHTIPRLHIQTIFDIGANSGHFSKEMRQRFPEAAIHAFEPLPDCIETLTKEFKDDQKFILHRCALGSSRTETEIQVSSFHPSSSLLPMSSTHKNLYPKSASSKPLTIPVRTLDEEVPIGARTGGILAKIDVQGFESEVLAGGSETFKAVSVIYIENSFIELYQGQKLFSEITTQLLSMGFAYFGHTHRHYNEKTHEPLYEDSVYIRKELLTENEKESQ
jgi:FkbM family methyltransferase